MRKKLGSNIKNFAFGSIMIKCIPSYYRCSSLHILVSNVFLIIYVDIFQFIPRVYQKLSRIVFYSYFDIWNVNTLGFSNLVYFSILYKR